MRQGDHDGIVVLLWGRESEVVFFPKSHTIEHGMHGKRSRWGYIPSEEKLRSYKGDTFKIPQGAM